MESPSSRLPVAAGGAAPAAIDALLAILRPLARVAVDHGIQFNQLEELMKRAMVDAAMDAVSESSADAAPPISRLSVISGIHRKEVKRLVETPDLSQVRSEQTPATEVYATWVSEPTWLDADGQPRALPRRPQDDGSASFESLARSVTTDVHPRTLLDEMLRLGLAHLDPASDTVSLSDGMVPSGEIDALLRFAGASVSDHLAAVRENLVAGHRVAAGEPTARPPFVEQSVFADELSAESVEIAGARARAIWQRIMKTLIPELQRLEAADREAGRPADHRIRVGLYCFAAPISPETGRTDDGAT